MKSRVTTLLSAAVIVAAFAAGLTLPTPEMGFAFHLAFIVLIIVISIRLMTWTGRKKLILGCGFFSTLIWLVAAYWPLSYDEFITTYWLENIYRRLMAINFPSRQSTMLWPDFRFIGEFAFSILAGFAGAGLAAYWSKEKHAISS